MDIYMYKVTAALFVTVKKKKKIRDNPNIHH